MAEIGLRDELNVEQAKNQKLKAEIDQVSQLAERETTELRDALEGLDRRHKNLNQELERTGQELSATQSRLLKLQGENEELRQKVEGGESRISSLEHAKASLTRIVEGKEARLEELSKEVKELADRNRALLKDEAAARSAAESGRYQAAAATAERERAETDRKLMEDRLAVMEARSQDERDRHARLEKKMQDANLELESDIAQVAEESGRVKSENVRLKADNDRLHEELQQLRRQLHEKDWALQDITEACEAEKSAFQKALEAAQEHRDSNQRDALRLKAQLAELSHLVEQLKQDETDRLQQVTAERDEAVEAAKRSEAHVAALVGARNHSPAAGALLPSPAAAREPLQPLLQGSAEAGAVIPVPGESTGSDQLSRTALVHKLELTERRLREQAHEIRRMRQEYDEAMSILKARTVDAEVQRKRFDNMHKAHINMTAALATVAEEKAAAVREVTRARAELASASRGAVLAARAANDRAAQVATLLEEVERLQGRPPPERAPVPFPDVAAGGVSGWADEAQEIVADDKLLGSGKSLDEVVSINAKLMTALRAVIADRDSQMEERLKEAEAELRPQLEAKVKEAQSLEAQAKEKDALLAQKQRQIDGLVEGMEHRPGASSSDTGENVAMARLKEKMAAEVGQLKAAQGQVHTRLREELKEMQKREVDATSEARAKAAEVQYATERATQASEEATRLREDLSATKERHRDTHGKLLEAFKALAEARGDAEAARARAAAAEKEVEGARSAAAAAEAATATADQARAEAVVRAAQAEAQQLAAEKMLAALQQSFDTVSARLDSQVEKADTEGAELRGKLAVVQQDLQAARLALAESTQEERADRAEAELEKAKEKAKTAEAAAATSAKEVEALAAVKAEQLRELTELRRRLAAAEAGPSGGDAAVAPGGAGPHSGGSDDAAALRAQLRCTQIDLNFARGEAERAQALAEQHRTAAVSLERQVAAMQKNLEELRKAKEAAAAAAAEDLKQAEERTQQAQQECSGLRTRTAAAERARLDATRALEDAKSTVEGLRRERDRLGKKGREQEERASRDAAEARTEIQRLQGQMDVLTMQASDYIQRMTGLKRDLDTKEAQLKQERDAAAAAARTASREATAAARRIDDLQRSLAATQTAAAAGGAAPAAGAGTSTAADAGAAAVSSAAEEASAEEARRLLLAARLQLKEAVGDAASKAATARRLQVQLDTMHQQVERAHAELKELREKVSAPLLSESAHRDRVQHTKDVEILRSSNDSLLREKEQAEQDLARLQERFSAADRRHTAAMKEHGAIRATLAQTKKALEDERKRSATWQEECNSILAKYGSDDQKALQEARTRCDSLQKEVDTLTRTAEASAKERSQLQKEIAALKKAAEARRVAPTPIVAPATLSKQGPAAAARRGAAAGASAPPPAALAELQESLKARDAVVARLEKELDVVKAELAAASEAMRGHPAKVIAKALDFEAKLEPFLESHGWKKETKKVKKDGKLVTTHVRVSVLKFIGKIVSERDEAQLEVTRLKAALEKAQVDAVSADTVKQVQQEKAALQSEMLTLQAKLADATAEVQRLQDKLAEAAAPARPAPAAVPAAAPAVATAAVPAAAATAAAATAAAVGEKRPRKEAAAPAATAAAPAPAGSAPTPSPGSKKLRIIPKQDPPAAAAAAPTAAEPVAADAAPDAEMVERGTVEAAAATAGDAEEAEVLEEATVADEEEEDMEVEEEEESEVADADKAAQVSTAAPAAQPQAVAAAEEEAGAPAATAAVPSAELPPDDPTAAAVPSLEAADEDMDEEYEVEEEEEAGEEVTVAAASQEPTEANAAAAPTDDAADVGEVVPEAEPAAEAAGEVERADEEAEGEEEVEVEEDAGDEVEGEGADGAAADEEGDAGGGDVGGGDKDAARSQEDKAGPGGGSRATEAGKAAPARTAGVRTRSQRTSQPRAAERKRTITPITFPAEKDPSAKKD